MNTPGILVVGFEPFDDEKINPSMQIARSLDGQCIAGREVN